MPNTSATGGYLLPGVSPTPVEGNDFEDFLHDVIQGITGVSGTLIRPRWQPDPPNMPQVAESWIAFGITDFIPDTYAVEQTNSEDDGSVDLIRHEVDTVLLSFYGPNASVLAGVFRDGLQISQNRSALVSAGVGMISTGEARQVPTLVKERWQKRIDMEWKLKRQILRNYPVLYLLTANVELNAEGSSLITTNIEAQP